MTQMWRRRPDNPKAQQQKGWGDDGRQATAANNGCRNRMYHNHKHKTPLCRLRLLFSNAKKGNWIKPAKKKQLHPSHNENEEHHPIE
jgi:hypothetical protein